jgi:hypothetical protein
MPVRAQPFGQRDLPAAAVLRYENVDFRQWYLASR